MKLHLLSLLSLFALVARTPSPVEVKIVYAPEEGTVLTRTHLMEMEGEQTGLVYTLGGEEVGDVEDAPGLESSGLERLVVTDEIFSVEDGRPLWLRREFDELVSEHTWVFEGEEEPVSDSHVSDLEGVTVDILWDEAEEGYRFTAADEEDIDADRLELLAEDMDYRAFLPEGEVAEGDSWELDQEAFLPILWAGGIMGFHPEEEEESDAALRAQEGTRDSAEVEGKATFEGQREEGGVRVAVITFELETETEFEYELESSESMPEDATRIAGGERTFEGELLWDLEHGHLHSVFIESEGEVWALDSGTMEVRGEEARVGWKRTMSIVSHFTVTVERQ